MSEKILTPEEATALYRRLPTMGKVEKLETLDLLDKQEHWRELRKKRQDPIEFAKQHKEFARAFESFPKDADALYPGWREKLGVHK